MLSTQLKLDILLVVERMGMFKSVNWNYGASSSGAQNKHFDDNLLFQQALSLQHITTIQ